jgi:hypothetical protein
VRWGGETRNGRPPLDEQDFVIAKGPRYRHASEEVADAEHVLAIKQDPHRSVTPSPFPTNSGNKK